MNKRLLACARLLACVSACCFLVAGVAIAGGQTAGRDSAEPGSAAETFDVLIVNGTVVDGSGNPYFRADVGIKDGKIARIGKLSGAESKKRIDAKGLVVAPGFIDPHVHAGAIFRRPTAENYLKQGVTTITDGNDGSSPRSSGEYPARVKEVGISVNIALYVGHGSVRRAVMGQADRAPTPTELEEMKGLVALGMEEGALGLSTGLTYTPGAFAGTEEVIELAKVAARYGGIYISHMRDEMTGVLDSVRETIRIGKEAQIPVQMTHHKVGGHAQFGQSVQSLQLIEQARREGIDITFDQYPYTASSTGITVLFPKWALADGKLSERLADETLRGRIKEGVLEKIEIRFGNDPSKLQFVSCRSDESLAGKTMAELLKLEGKEPTPSVFADRVIQLQIDGGCSGIYHSYDEADVQRFLKSEFGMIGSDGGLVSFGSGSPHPRAYGTYPRVLGRYVRELGVLSLEAAIRKMTSFPAQRLGLLDRGLIREGLIADVVVFAPEEIGDRATFTDPHQYSVGIKHVLVNGVLVLESGEPTGARPGRMLFGPGKK